MRKVLPYIFGILETLSVSLLISSGFSILGAAMTAFSVDHGSLFFLFGVAALALAVLIGTAIANIRFLFQAQNPKHCLMVELIVFALLVLPFWAMWEKIIFVLFP